jgi:hypothetical protein
MVRRASKRLLREGVDLILIENVGNLICPAEFPLGAHERVVVVSVTEGEYMIKKKNDIFRAAEVNVKKLEFVAKTYDKFYAPHPLLLKMVKERTGKEIDINSQETDDPNVFRILREGKTEGIFQFESPGMTKLLGQAVLGLRQFLSFALELVALDLAERLHLLHGNVTEELLQRNAELHRTPPWVPDRDE